MGNHLFLLYTTSNGDGRNLRESWLLKATGSGDAINQLARKLREEGRVFSFDQSVNIVLKDKKLDTRRTVVCSHVAWNIRPSYKFASIAMVKNGPFVCEVARTLQAAKNRLLKRVANELGPDGKASIRVYELAISQ